jgi:hypothetical protein
MWYTVTDCNGDGILDQACTSETGDMRGTILSNSACRSTWSRAPASECRHLFQRMYCMMDA